MSILLDAVVKQKQQQAGGANDTILLPSTSRKINSHNAVAKFGLLAVSIVLAVGGAWALHKLLNRPAEHFTNTQPANMVNRIRNTEDQTPNPSQAVTSSADFRLAGKVALPVPKSSDKPYAVVQTQDNLFQDKIQPSLPQSFEQTPSDVAPLQSNNTDVDGLSLAQLELLSQQYDQQLQNAYQQERILKQAESESEPIILGANANERGLRELEALQLQVNMAANEVDFASVKQPVGQNDNNLTAAFAAALKEVEYEQSANYDVTPDELSPITKPKPQGIPKYGDLPASVQLKVPEFNINAHVYSTDPNNRWLNVDGEELQQGDIIQGKLTIIEIRPRDVILEIDGQEFKVPAI
ncbi:general secretion pathway protein GspB [Shewanella aestuarii]|uniref:General secretion pathway protein GspB n=1 Tax=Shewanella aestuarii TaxID=1028752 RepID=A0A6G9QL66_9GAMM|nr:general secretion pathway protein GspB [Shewanella aestuarii]QIR15276.1 general secretion pathway protein GspB [Shewanella aestuarii]